MFLLTLLKDHLLEVGWNNSESTQRDVEKSLNCCGFKHVDPNSMCEAVSLDQVFSKCFLSHVTYLSMSKQADDGSGFLMHNKIEHITNFQVNIFLKFRLT